MLVLVILLPAFAAGDAGIAPPYFCKYVCPAGTLGGGIPNIHRAGALTLPAPHALFLVKAHLIKAEPVKQRPKIKRNERKDGIASNEKKTAFPAGEPAFAGEP